MDYSAYERGMPLLERIDKQSSTAPRREINLRVHRLLKEVVDFGGKPSVPRKRGCRTRRNPLQNGYDLAPDRVAVECRVRVAWILDWFDFEFRGVSTHLDAGFLKQWTPYAQSDRRMRIGMLPPRNCHVDEGRHPARSMYAASAKQME